MIVNQRPVSRWYNYRFKINKPAGLGYRDLYKRYKYKKPPYDNNIRISAGLEHTLNPNHRYSISYKDWTDFVKTYFDVMFDHIIEGKTYIAPHNMGTFKVFRLKGYDSSMKLLKDKDQVLKYLTTNSFRATDFYPATIRWIKPYHLKSRSIISNFPYFKFNWNKKKKLEFFKLLTENGKHSYRYDVEHNKL